MKRLSFGAKTYRIEEATKCMQERYGVADEDILSLTEKCENGFSSIVIWARGSGKPITAKSGEPE